MTDSIRALVERLRGPDWDAPSKLSVEAAEALEELELRLRDAQHDQTATQVERDALRIKADRISGALADAANVPADFEHAEEAIRKLTSERDALRAENEALRADRERLDWLGEQHGMLNDEMCQHTVYVEHDQDIRSAIDAARAAGKETM